MVLLGQVLSLRRLLQLYNPKLVPAVSRTPHSSINILRSRYLVHIFRIRYLIHIFNVAVFHCGCVSSRTLTFWSLQISSFICEKTDGFIYFTDKVYRLQLCSQFPWKLLFAWLNSPLSRNKIERHHKRNPAIIRSCQE